MPAIVADVRVGPGFQKVPRRCHLTGNDGIYYTYRVHIRNYLCSTVMNCNLNSLKAITSMGPVDFSNRRSSPKRSANSVHPTSVGATC